MNDRCSICGLTYDDNREYETHHGKKVLCWHCFSSYQEWALKNFPKVYKMLTKEQIEKLVKEMKCTTEK